MSAGAMECPIPCTRDHGGCCRCGLDIMKHNADRWGGRACNDFVGHPPQRCAQCNDVCDDLFPDVHPQRGEQMVCRRCQEFYVSCPPLK